MKHRRSCPPQCKCNWNIFTSTSCGFGLGFRSCRSEWDQRLDVFLYLLGLTICFWARKEEK